VKPDPPENVRLVGPDGTEWACTLTYDGVVGGIHHWTAHADIPPQPHWRGWKARVDTLPGRTAVTFEGLL